jgi:hypothetical protein
MQVTRENFEALLDAGQLFAAMTGGKWWRLRRNGKTQTWKLNPQRIRVPVKCGFRTTTAIDETDFDADGNLKADLFRHVTDVPGYNYR